MWKRLCFLGVVMGMIVLLVVPASAGPKGEDRPFKARLAGEITFAFGAPCSEGPIVTTSASGNATHMGRVQADFVQCALGASGGFVGQTGMMEAANGDYIYFAETDNVDGQNPYLVEIVGGSGRFDGADGEVWISFGVVPQLLPPDVCTPSEGDPCFDPTVPWPWSASMTGVISY